jgi:hypothetical protein
MRSDQQAHERRGGEAAVGRGPPARLIRGRPLEIDLHGGGLAGSALRRELGGMAQHRAPHRLARPAPVSGGRAAILLVDLVLFVRRWLVHANSFSTSRSLLRA